MRAMSFEHSGKVVELQQRLNAFMREHVYPNESTFHRQIAAGDRWQPTAIVVARALFRGDATTLRTLFPQLLTALEQQTVLYVPLNRNGDPAIHL